MSDAFLTLAQRRARAVVLPGAALATRTGRATRIRIQRLKDKLGNRSNASAEIEYDGAWAVIVGEEGGGVPTIIEMVHHTRLDCAFAAARPDARRRWRGRCTTRRTARLRAALIEQPLMRQVLADIALEVEAAMALVLRVARAFDERKRDRKRPSPGWQWRWPSTGSPSAARGWSTRRWSAWEATAMSRKGRCRGSTARLR